MGTTRDWDALRWTETGDLGSLLHELPDEAFDQPSLCDGWEVRDVLAHVLAGHTTTMPRMIRLLAGHGFNVTKTSAVESRNYARDLSADQIREQWDAMVANRTTRGISRMIPAKESFVDHMVHHQDIRRALHRPREIPEERMVAALEGAVTLSSPMFAPKRQVRDLRLSADDCDFAHGEGATVEGPGEAILMAAAGRSAALPDLTGDGVAVLASRIGGGNG
jgi:uncharacterized protein (TIGR03083 family)